MSLSPGQTLLHYRIVDKLGEGGMGEVWKAMDTTLNRTVAIKVLPAHFSSDPERLGRFEREAKTLAALNHPHIGALYGLHESDGLHFLCLEYIEGEDLASRLQRGALPIDEVVAIATAIAEALAAAHGKGIVHRDLKPANVMLTTDGQPKVLDFGLAKAAPSDGAQAHDASLSPTVTSLGTMVGTILGTAAYMSPEQARAKPVDRRSDLWSFGVVLYEMLTGTRLFGGGETLSDTLASVLKNEPDWQALPSNTPEPVRRLLRRCLQREPKNRLHDADDARLELENAFAEDHAGPAAVEASRRPAGIALAVALALIAGLAIGFVLRGRSAPVSSPTPVVSSLLTPPGVAVHVDDLSFSLSPDGEQLAFAGVDSNGRRDLYVRQLGSGATEKLAGTESARNPFWSPDGSEIGFHAGTRMLRIPSRGGTPQLIADKEGAFGSWNRDDKILFSTESLLMLVDAGGGIPEALEGTGDDFTLYSSPQFLPDGKHFIFDRLTQTASTSGIYLGSLGSTEVRQLVECRSNGVYAGGKLMYLRGSHLVAQSLDLATFDVSGEPERIAGPLLRVNYPFHGLFSSSSTGERLVYLPGDESTGLSEIVWVDRSGKELERTEIRGDLYNPRLSHDGRRLGLDVSTPETHGDIWVFDLARNSSRRLTSDPIDESRPVWMPDDSKLLFFRIPDLYEIGSSGGEDARQIYANGNHKYMSDVSPDGRSVLFIEVVDTHDDLMVLDLESGEARPWLNSKANESGARFAPKGDWLAYTSNESGSDEVYVDRFPERGERFRISSDGGHVPIWRADGKELFYLSLSDDMMAVPVDMDSDRAPIGTPAKLFSSRLRSYDVSVDGQRFLLNQRIEVDVSEMILLQNRQSP